MTTGSKKYSTTRRRRFQARKINKRIGAAAKKFGRGSVGQDPYGDPEAPYPIHQKREMNKPMTTKISPLSNFGIKKKGR